MITDTVEITDTNLTNEAVRKCKMLYGKFFFKKSYLRLNSYNPLHPQRAQGRLVDSALIAPHRRRLFHIRQFKISINIF
jgi:hypothetical protein